MFGLSVGKLLVIAIVVALVTLVLRRRWLVASGRRPERFRRAGRERDDPRIRVKEIGSRRADDR